MAFRFARKDDSVEAAVRRIACEQIDSATVSIDRRERAEAVHDVRKRCKKLRALVRLVRPCFAGFDEENAEYRDTARLVSSARDAQVMIDTYDSLVRHYRHEVDRREFGSIRRRFTLQRKAETEGDLDQALDEVRDRLQHARERARGWQLQEDGWEALSKGLAKSYGRARKAAAIAHAKPTDENFHDLRKRIKYHWYHCRLFAPLWPQLMATHIDVARELSDQFGFHHDFAVFAGKLALNPPAYGTPEAVARAVGLAERRQREIEDEAWPMIERLLAQQPAELARYWGRLWAIWRDEGNRQGRLDAN